MTIRDYMDRRGLKKSELSRLSGIPYSTLSDIVSGKTSIETCSASVVYKLSKALGVSMEELIGAHCEKRQDFEWFKSEMCHELKRKGDTGFVLHILENNLIPMLYNWEWYEESFYLLAMVDYLSRVNGIDLVHEYEPYRHQKIDPPIFPADVLITAAVSGEAVKDRAIKNAIPEFLRQGIVEGNIRDAV